MEVEHSQERSSKRRGLKAGKAGKPGVSRPVWPAGAFPALGELVDDEIGRQAPPGLRVQSGVMWPVLFLKDKFGCSMEKRL